MQKCIESTPHSQHSGQTAASTKADRLLSGKDFVWAAMLPGALIIFFGVVMSQSVCFSSVCRRHSAADLMRKTQHFEHGGPECTQACARHVVGRKDEAGGVGGIEKMWGFACGVSHSRAPRRIVLLEGARNAAKINTQT